MKTFDAAVGARCFWAAVFAPPVLFFGLVQYWGGAGSLPGGAGFSQLVVLLALAQAMPLIALGWTLCSVAAYSVGVGRLVVHRVVRDREFSLNELDEPPRLAHGVVTLSIAGRRLRVRAVDPENLFDALATAIPRGAQPSNRKAAFRRVQRRA